MAQKKWMAILLVLLLTGCAAAAPGTDPVQQGDRPAVEAPVEQESVLQKPAEEESTAPGEPEKEQEAPSQENGAQEQPGEETSEAVQEPGREEEAAEPESKPEEPAPEEPMDQLGVKEEAAALKNAAAAMPSGLEATASGALVSGNGKAEIDYSNTADGYVMVRYGESTEKRLKAQVVGPSTTYTYNIKPEQWEVFPLSDGNGSYKVTVYENVTDNKYAAVVSVTHNVTMRDEFAPFLRPNQYVDYGSATATVAKAAEIAGGAQDTLQKVKLVYEYVVENLTYDKEKAATVKSGYLPNLDRVLSTGKGICFDYAALMAGMLRSQGVPSKLVVGYAGQAYHAWISVWTEESGWMDSVIYFDGSVWKRMDPTFASSDNQSESIMAYIGDGKNYTEKYFY